MPLGTAIRPGYVSTPGGVSPDTIDTPSFNAAGSVSASASTQATGVLVLLLVAVVVIGERWLR
jgi:hypothetical protein